MKQDIKKRDKEYLTRHKYNERIRMKAGTFLHTYCPVCSESLIRDNFIHLIAVNAEGEEGDLKLSPYLNSFRHESTIDIQSATELKDVKCPHCGESIVQPDQLCGSCNAHTAKLMVAAVHIRVPLLICMKEGCHWHGITPEDERKLIKDASDEW